MVLKPATLAAQAPHPDLFSIKGLVNGIRESLFALPDYRKGGNNQAYAIGDAAPSAFSVFFMQSRSFLDYQRRMQKERARNNARSLFGVHQIPSTQQIGNLLDPIAPSYLDSLFIDIVDTLHQHRA